MAVVPLWMRLPETGSGWVFWCALWALQLWAAAVIVRDMQSRPTSGWDVAALGFVTVGGPGAAGAFLLVHDLRDRRTTRRRKVAPRSGRSVPDGS